ncbi:MAG: anti-sigma F factor [Clostridia bacterium]|jgi:stage II sporulation protein AB (anti-sigma F factor)|nr:anti-sigma F factor [Clostridia bacterium]
MNTKKEVLEKNEMTLTIKSYSQNESFARSTVAAFCVQANPTLEEINDVKTAVSEAVTNCVVHAYPNSVGDILIKAEIQGNTLKVTISDWGVGIQDIKKAMEPFYTSKPEQERSGMGFTVMESFMDIVEVSAQKPNGVKVEMTKTFKSKASSSKAEDKNA